MPLGRVARSAGKTLAVISSLLPLWAAEEGRPSPEAISPKEAVVSIHSALETAADEVTASRLLGERRTRLKGLMATQPAAALELRLPERLRDRLLRLSPSIGNLLEEQGEWEEEAEVIEEDDFARGISRTRYRINTGGRSVAVYFAEPPPALKCGDRIRVQGVRLDDVMAVRLAGVQVSAAGCSPLGDQKTAVLLLNFPSASLPAGLTPSYVTSIFFGASGHSQNDHWREASYGRTWSSGTVFGPFTLSQNFSCSQDSQIRDAAIAAADSVVDFRLYTRLVLVLPLACGAWATIGCRTLTSADGSFTASTMWLGTDAFNTSDLAVCMAVHEGGHNFGLRHASTLAFSSAPLSSLGATGSHDEYGDYFSLMGACFNYAGTQLLGHYAAPHKQMLGWFAPGNVVTVQTSGSYTIQPFENTTAGVQALKVERGAGSNLWLWLEYRRPIGYDATYQPYSSQPYTGVLVHYEDPSNATYSGYTRLLDFTAATTPGVFSDPALAAGQSWSDPFTPLTLQVSNAAASGVTVNVSYDTPCTAVTPASRTYGAGAVASDTVSVTAAQGCSWTAVSNASWITVLGSTSSQVTYSVSANSGATSRKGSISIGRFLFFITQSSANSPPTPVSVTPNGASVAVGAVQPFTAVYSDGDGATNLSQARLLFSTSDTQLTGACHLVYDRASNQLRLYNDGGDSWSSWNPGANQTLSNSQCTVHYGSSSAQISGNTLTLVAAVSFTSAFAGPKSIYSGAKDAAGADSGFQSMGSVTVQQPVLITIATAPAGLSITVDGVTATAPQTYSWLPGSIHSISTASPQGGGAVRYIFSSWSDSGAQTHNIATPGAPATYTASFVTQYLLTRAVSPAGAGTVNATPYSADGYYNSGTVVQLLATAAAGRRFQNWSGDLTGIANPQPVTMTAPRSATANFQATTRTQIGVTGAGFAIQDLNGNFTWDGVPTDRFVYWGAGLPGEVMVAGDWNGDGRAKIGFFRDGLWMLDYNGNGVWDAGDKLLYFGGSGSVPVVGDWNGSRTTKVGVYRDGMWILDYNGNFAWDAGTDKLIYFGVLGQSPVVGDWNGSGSTKIGVYQDGMWILDYNGNFAWDAGTDKIVYFGSPGQTPVVGDWNGSGSTKLGVFKEGLWILDYNGNFAWDAGTDKVFYFGETGQTPVVGDWNGSGTAKVGVFRDGLWLADYNGNFAWDAGTDKIVYFGAPGNAPFPGGW